MENNNKLGNKLGPKDYKVIMEVINFLQDFYGFTTLKEAEIYLKIRIEDDILPDKGGMNFYR